MKARCQNPFTRIHHYSRADIITWENEQNCPVLYLNIPSSLDADFEAVYEPTARATANLTLILAEVDMQTSGANPYPRVILRDISITRGLYAVVPLNLMVEN